MSGHDNGTRVQYEATAWVRPVSGDQACELALRCANLGPGLEKVAASPVGPDGKPKLLHISAWIAHAGDPNGNGDAFLAADLKEAVEQGLFAAPNLGMVDHDHQFDAIGAWYKAVYAYNKTRGDYGILAHGIIWAWRYESIADGLLADMESLGHVRVSMSCLSPAVVRKRGRDGREYNLVRRPIFLTTSTLSVRQADSDAIGLATTDPTESAEDRELSLLAASAEATWERQPVVHEQEIEPMKMDLLTVVASATSEEPEVVVASAELEATISALEATQAELRLALAAADSELNGLRAECDELRSYRNRREAEDREAERVRLIEARLAELAPAVRQALQEMEEADRLRIVARWADQDEAEWGLTRTSLRLTRPSAGPDYVATSAKEGPLVSSTGRTAAGRYAVDAFVK
jgi:hypothetical protein